MGQDRLIPGWFKGALAIMAFSAWIAFASDPWASTRLKTLSSCSYDFRMNDRDWNRVNDFWTTNVTGLYSLTSIQEPGFLGRMVLGASRSLDHLQNPTCQHPVKEWPEQNCPRIFWSNVD